MRGARVGMLALTVLVLAGCGSSAHFVDKPRPPAPVNVTVYVDDARVSISPSSVGAGPVMFVVTNQGSQSVQLAVMPAASGSALATTAPINPQTTSSFSVDFRPGVYTVGTSPNANTLSAAKIKSASLHVGRSRANGNSVLMEP